MAFIRKVYSDLDFVYTQCHGVLDDSSLRIHLLSFNIEVKGMKTIKEVADLRGIKKADRGTVRGLIELADLDRKQSAGRDELLAIIVNEPLISEMARLYSDLLKNSKADIAVFMEVTDALSWFGYSEQEMAVLRGFIKKHRA